MLTDATIHAADPERVARFLALLWGTEAMPVPGAEERWIAFTGEETAATVVVARAHLPRPEARLAVATRLNETAVHALAATEGWRSRHASRFGEVGSAVSHAVVEVAVEHGLVLEVLPAEMAAARAEAIRPWRWGAMLAGLVAPPRQAGPAPVPELPPIPVPTTAPITAPITAPMRRAA